MFSILIGQYVVSDQVDAFTVIYWHKNQARAPYVLSSVKGPVSRHAQGRYLRYPEFQWDIFRGCKESGEA